MAFQKAVPTSFGGLKSTAKAVPRGAMWVAVAIAGLGLYALASPFLKRVPLVGGLLRGGESMIPGKAATMTVDQWGRVR